MSDKLTTQVRNTLIPDAGQLEVLLFAMAYEIEELREEVAALKRQLRARQTEDR